MIKIKFGKNYEATFSDQRWKCDDKVAQKMLNVMLDLDDVSVSSAYRTSEYDKDVFGLDGVALDSVSFLSPEIAEYEPDLILEEEEGVVT